MNISIEKLYATLKSDLQTIAKKRKRAQFFQKTMWGLTGLFFLLMLLIMISSMFPNLNNSFLNELKNYWVSNNSDTLGAYLKLLPIFVLFAVISGSTYYFSKAFSSFKTLEWLAVKKMITSLFPKFKLSQIASFPMRELNKTKLFTSVKSENAIIYGHLKNKELDLTITDIGIIEKNVQKGFVDTLLKIPYLNIVIILYQYVFKNVITSKSADAVYYTFRGMFCWTSFDKKLEGHTVILPKNISSKINRNINHSFKKEEKITLENPEFVKNFDVYATDQIEARYVLSATFMEKVVALKNAFNRDIMVSFTNGKAYVAVHNPHGLFSFSETKLNSIKIIEELVVDINSAISIVDEFKVRQTV